MRRERTERLVEKAPILAVWETRPVLPGGQRGDRLDRGEEGLGAAVAGTATGGTSSGVSGGAPSRGAIERRATASQAMHTKNHVLATFAVEPGPSKKMPSTIRNVSTPRSSARSKRSWGNRRIGSRRIPMTSANRSATQILAAPLSTEEKAQLDAAEFGTDVVRPAGRQIYIYYRHGMAGSDTATRLVRLIKTTATDRNWNTITKLSAIAGR